MQAWFKYQRDWAEKRSKTLQNSKFEFYFQNCTLEFQITIIWILTLIIHKRKLISLIFCKQPVKGNLHIFSFSWLKIRLFKLHIWNGMVKGFSKMYNFSFFGQIFFCKHFYYIIGFCDKKFNFCKFAFFVPILKVEHKSFPMMYHLSYLDIKHGI